MKETKEKYEELELEVIRFETEDVITLSGPDPDETDLSNE
jgi:hypothetical protein